MEVYQLDEAGNTKLVASGLLDLKNKVKIFVGKHKQLLKMKLDLADDPETKCDLQIKL